MKLYWPINWPSETVTITDRASSMRRILQRLGRQVAATQFKRTPHGWIFRAPTVLPFGPRPHYLVHHRQKVKIETVIAACHIVFFLLAALSPLWLLLYPKTGLLDISSSLDTPLGAVMLWCLFATVMHPLCQHFSVQPLLKGMPSTTERITVVERLEPLAMMFSKRLLISSFVFLILMLLFSTFHAFRRSDIISLIGVAAMSWITAYYGLALWVRRQLSGRA